MIGEIRDAETAQIAMRSALTGHLVLSTLHTNDAPSTFWRLRDIGVELYLIAATINLVISQRLVRVLCEGCKHEVKPTLEEVKVASLVDPQAHAVDLLQRGRLSALQPHRLPRAHWHL
jgi:type II secretory ATPase GspE/PulE/Tfp pilus assembly ATPase PilB-like protein